MEMRTQWRGALRKNPTGGGVFSFYNPSQQSVHLYHFGWNLGPRRADWGLGIGAKKRAGTESWGVDLGRELELALRIWAD